MYMSVRVPYVLQVFGVTKPSTKRSWLQWEWKLVGVEGVWVAVRDSVLSQKAPLKTRA